MKRILATAALVSLLAACTNAAEDSPTTIAPDTNGSAGPDLEEPETTEPDTTAPESPDAESESPDDTDPDESDSETTPPDDEGGFDGSDSDTDFSDFTTEETQSEGFPDLLGDFFPVEARVGGHETYDRVVIEYDEGEGQLNWGAYYTDVPTQDGSGFVVDMEGEQFLTLTISGVRYPHDEEMGHESEIVASGLNQSEVIADVNVDFPFEGMHLVHIGVDEQRPYRVVAFHDPARLVIDIQND